EWPWDLGPVHAGLAGLNRQFEAASRPAPRELHQKLARLRKELAAANKEANAGRDFKAAQRAGRLAQQVNALQARLDRSELRGATAWWGEKTYRFRQGYLDTVGKHYGDGVAFPVDFVNEPEAARQRINAWVAGRTRDRIGGLIPAGAVNRDTRLVVSNAVYFKGQWADPFKEAQTQGRDFALAGGKQVRVPTMHGYPGGARYAAFNGDGTFFDTPTRVEEGAGDTKGLYPGPGGFELLELAYKGGELSMAVIVPRSHGGLPALEKRLSGADLRTWLGKLRQRPVEVFLPKFKMESSFDLGRSLAPLGMKRAFPPPTPGGGAP